MKNKYSIGSIPLFVLALCIFFTIPTLQASAQTTSTTVAVTTPVLTSDASVSVAGQPTLNLTYSPSQGESLLTAAFIINVNGGTKGINIYNSSANFIDQNGKVANAGSRNTASLTPIDFATTTVDNLGNKLFVIPAGKNVKFRHVVTVNPKQLFAGTYHASEQAVTATLDTYSGNGLYLYFAANKTNSKTIVGEVSPYISSVTSPVSAGSMLTITGQRLSGAPQSTMSSSSRNYGRSIVYIDGALFAGAATFSTNGTKVTLTVPASFTPGSNHSVFIKNSITGASNYVGFQINSGTIPSNFVNLIVEPSVGGGSQYVGIRASIKGDISNKRVSTWLLNISCSTGVTMLDPRSADLCNTNQTYYASNYYDVTQDIVLLTIDAKNNGTSNNPNVTFVLTAYDANGVIGSDKEIVSFGPTTPVDGQPTINFNTTGGIRPSLVLGYDSMNKESLLTATFNFSVNGGSQGVNIVQNSGGAVFTDQNGNRPNLNSTRNTLKAINSGTITTTDNYGQVLYKVPAGKNVDFQLVTTAIPREMFAGSYNASLVAVSANPGNIITDQYSLSAPSNKTNSVTIVGELSPYISSITSPVSVGQVVMVKGQRLNGMTFAIDGQLIQNSLVSISIDGTSLSFVLPSSVVAGQHYFTVNNDTTGLSNRAGFQVGTGVTPPTSFDSDGGKNYFVKGTTTGITKCVYQDQCTTPTTSVDVCWKDNHEGAAGNQNQLHEYYIGADGYKYVEFYQSPTGCENGAAKQSVPNTLSLTMHLDPMSPMDGPVAAGSSNIPLVIFDVSAGSGDVQLGGFAAGGNNGTLSQKLTNVGLYEGSTLLATGIFDQNNGSYNLSAPILVASNTSRVFTIKGDVLPGTSGAIQIVLGGIFHNYGTSLSVQGLGFSGGLLTISPTTTQSSITVTSPNGRFNIEVQHPRLLMGSSSQDVFLVGS
jgi:hypothetical protein